MRFKLIARALASCVSRASMLRVQGLHLVAYVLLARRLNLREHHLPLYVLIALRVYIMKRRVNQFAAAVLITPLLTLAKPIV